MGSNLRNPDYIHSMFEGPSCFLDRGPVADAFTEEGPCCDEPDPRAPEKGFLTRKEIWEQREFPECPWHLDDPLLGPQAAGQGVRCDRA
jgi:hypothetical protein